MPDCGTSACSPCSAPARPLRRPAFTPARVRRRLTRKAVNVSSIRAFRTTFRDEFRLWRHLLVPATATVFFLFPLWGILHPHGRTLMDLCIPQPDDGGITLTWVTISQDGPTGWSRGSDHSVPGGGCPASRCLRSASSPPACWPRPPFFLAGGALLLGIPVYMAQRRHLTRPALVSAYR